MARAGPRSISAAAPTGCALLCSAPTTGSCRPQALCWAWPRPARRPPRSSSLGLPGWWPVRCRWRQESTCPLARSATPSGPTSAWRSASFAGTRTASCASLPGSTSDAACRPRSQARWLWRCRATARWRRTRGTSSASTRSGWPIRFRPLDLGALVLAGAALPLLAIAVDAGIGARFVAAVGCDTDRARGARKPRGAAGRGAAASSDGPGGRLGRCCDGDHRGHRRARRHGCLGRGEPMSATQPTSAQDRLRAIRSVSTAAFQRPCALSQQGAWRQAGSCAKCLRREAPLIRPKAFRTPDGVLLQRDLVAARRR